MLHGNVAAEPVVRLIEEFNRLPGIGPKTAQRLTYHLLRVSEPQAKALAEAIIQVKEKIFFCSTCFNMTETDPCLICTGEGRDRTTICVVEEPLDILALERTREYRGLYHVLHGAISPLEGVMPEDLRIGELQERLRSGEVREVILATNPNMEGENTANYIHRLLQSTGVRITRLARGLPVGGDLEYADEVTLKRAIEGRREI